MEEIQAITRGGLGRAIGLVSALLCKEEQEEHCQHPPKMTTSWLLMYMFLTKLIETDLNPVENLWDIMDGSIQSYQVATQTVTDALIQLSRSGRRSPMTPSAISSEACLDIVGSIYRHVDDTYVHVCIRDNV